jgi:anaerobic selenocysteine-containing dehydrogenase
MHSHFTKRNLLILLLVIVGVVAAFYVIRKSRAVSGGTCQTKESCLNDPSCQCYCSVKCGFRKKEENDKPVYIENDPNGKYCYCKQWDADNYVERGCAGKEV